jgi:PGF-CTERM protein
MRRVTALSLALLAALLVAPVAAHEINHLSADPQVSTDGQVVLESAYATEDGFVVLYRDWNGTGGEVVGVRPFSATTRDVTEVTAAVNRTDPSSLPANVTLTAVLHADTDDDGTFDPATDAPLSAFGRATQATFTVRRGDTPAYVSAAGLAPQRTTERATVREVALASDGHLVLRASVGGDPATVVGTTALAAGVHRNVTVPLDAEYVRGRNGTFAVFAMVYTDDGDGRFDDGDRPVRAGETFVATRFSVDPSAGTPTPLVNTPTGTETQSPGAASAAPTSGTGPGFGALLAVVTLLALAALVVRRRG